MFKMTSTRTIRRKKLGLTFERLEQRVVLYAGAIDWLSAFDFSTNGDTASVTGFGIDDGQPDLNRDGISDASGVRKAPKFAGLDTGVQTVDIGGIEHPCIDLLFDEVCFGYYGAEITGSFSAKLGLELGFYMTDSTASVINAGNFSYNVKEPTNGSSPFVIDTVNALTDSSLYTTQAQISMYADLVISIHVDLQAQGALFEKFPPIPIEFDIEERIEVSSLNRQVRDGSGKYVFNADGTPQFDGKLLLFGLDPFMIVGKNQGAPLVAQIYSATQESKKAEQALKKANIDLEQAQTNSAKKDANKAIVAAQEKIAAAVKKVNDLTDRQANGQTAAQKFGELITLCVEQGTGNVLGLALEMGIGAGVTTGIPGINPNVNLEVGSVSVTMPRINLVDSQADENGNLFASTSAFPAASRQDIDRTVLNFSFHPTALIGMGTYTASLFPLAAKLTTIDDTLSTSLKINQTVSAQRQPDLAAFNFTNKLSGNPMPVTYSVNGGTNQTGTSASFIPGQSINIQQVPGIDQLVMTPRLQQSYDFSNSLGLDLSMINYFKALAFELSVLGESIIDVGPLYERTDPIFDKDLGVIKSSRFPVQSPVVTLAPFDLVQTKSDLQVVLQSGPPASVFVTPADPNPLMTYTVVVTNNGVNDATGVNVTNYFNNSQLKFNPVSSSPGITMANSAAVFNIGDLPAGQSRTLTFSGNYVTGGGTSISSVIVARGNEFDPVPNNNFHIANTSLTLPLVFEVRTESEFRAAINQVNNAVAVVPPLIYLRTSFMTLTQGEIAISKSVMITTYTNDKVVIDAQGQSRHFRLGGAGKQVYRFDNVSLGGGNGAGVNPGLGGSILMIDEDDTLSMDNSAVFQSTALTGGKLGGGIYQKGGFLNLNTVRVVDNQATTGGGMYLENATANFNNAIVLTNSATVQGGGLEATSTGGGSSTVAIINSDFKDNQAPLGANIHNLANSGSSLVTLNSSTFGTAPPTAGTTAPPNFANQSLNGATASITSLGNNIASDDALELTEDTDRTSTPPGMHVSSLEIASGQNGYIIGKMSMNWPNIVGKVNYVVSDQDNFIVVGDVLMLRPSRKFNITTTKLVPLAIVANDETNQTVGRNTNFLFRVVAVNLPPANVTVSYASPDGVEEEHSVAYGNGLVVGTVQATDPNSDDALTYSVDDARFQIVLEGNVPKLYLKPGESLNFEEASSVPLKITVVDSGGLSRTDSTVVTVKNILEAPTEIAGGNGKVPAGLKGAIIGSLNTIGPEGISAEFNYTVDDPRFEIAKDGLGRSILKLKADQSLPNSTAAIEVNVTAKDSSNLSVVQKFDIVGRTPVKPVSSMSTLATRTSLTKIPLAWTGSSSEPGPLVFNVYVSTDGGEYLPLLVSSAQSTVEFTAEIGHQYSFIVQAVDSQGNAEPLQTTADTFIVTTSTPWQNPKNALDVNNGGFISPSDALQIINFLNAGTNRLLSKSKVLATDPFFDVSGDGRVSATDALQIINELNRNSGGEGESTLIESSIFEGWPQELDDQSLGLMQGFEIYEMLRRRKSTDAFFDKEELK